MSSIRSRNRGVILITAMWVMVILGVVVIVYAHQMRTELLAAANRANANIASSVEMGAEQYVLASVDNIDGEADYVLGLPGEALAVGNPQQQQQGGYFWLLRPAANEQDYEFGITDECSKLNLNYATAAQIIQLPGMTNPICDSIIDWIDTDSNSTNSDGAESTYYESLAEPYSAKNQPMETVEELRLVQGIDDSILFGIDRNRNGVIESGELSQGSTPQSSTGISANRGIFPFVTVFSTEPNTDMQGNARINVNALATGVGGRNAVAGGGRNGGSGRTAGRGGGGSSQAGQQLLQALSGAMSASKAQAAVRAAQNNGPFANIFDFAQKANLTSQDLAPVADKLSFTTGTATTSPGLINVNTAPREVLLTLPGVQQNDVDTLISERQREDQTSLASIMWVAQALPLNRAAQIGKYLTSRSFIYSADIVAVSFDGRSFKRVRIVVDATASPAKIIYREDLTASGWPLPLEVRQSLKEGHGPGPSMQGSFGSGGGLGSLGSK